MSTIVYRGPSRRGVFRSPSARVNHLEAKYEISYLRTMAQTLLEVRDLGVHFRDNERDLPIIEHIDFSVKRGEVFALIGESGCGKSTLAYSLTNLLTTGYHVHGEVLFQGRPIHSLDHEDLRAIRRKNIRYVFQEPSLALSPIHRVKTQYLRALGHAGSSERPRALVTDLRRVGIENPDEVLTLFPHQLSGGTLQRVLIAMALSAMPDLIIADEPTSSVDAPLQRQLLDLLYKNGRTDRTAMILITHDLNIARHYADTVAVMYAGRIVEMSPVGEFFDRPLHPYALSLFEGTRLGDTQSHASEVRDSAPPHPANMPGGCKYHPRCSRAQSECRTVEPPMQAAEPERFVRCPFWK